MQAVARIDEPAISGNQYLGAEIAAGESGRQAGDGLPRCEPSRPGIVIEQDDVRAFFLNGIEPTSIRVEVEMPRPVSRRQRDRGRIIQSEHALLLIELPDKDLIQAQIGVQDEAPRWIGLDHVSMSPIVSANGEASRRSIRRLGRPQLAGIGPDVRGGPQGTVGQDRQHRHRAAKIIGDQQKASGRMHA